MNKNPISISSGTATANTGSQASPAEIRDAVRLMASSLPRRQTASTTDAKLILVAYGLALEGVSAEILRLAVTAIMQNSLGHPFMPAPPELRGECDRVAWDRRFARIIAGEEGI